MSQSSYGKRRAPVLPEPKAKGANRSTKLASKLKVLPEQPDNLPSLDNKTKTPPVDKAQTESTVTTGESEGEVESSEESQEQDVEVGISDKIGSTAISTEIHTDIQSISSHS